MAYSINNIANVVAFVDWNAQLLLACSNVEDDPERAAELAFKLTARRIANCLHNLDANRRFKVVLRLYHGWHKGFEPTPNRKAAQLIVGRTDFAALSQRPNILFSQNVGFGDRLTNALDRRLHFRLTIHLPNTVRIRYKQKEEKMVDTALVADVVATAYTEGEGWIVVVAEDDDLIPSIYVAESALMGTNSRVVLLRKRGCPGMMRLDDLLVKG